MSMQDGERIIKQLVLHCSDSPDSMVEIGVKEITKWHQERGWRTCGYHYVIRRSGKIEFGRAEFEVGAHVKGHNDDTIGICWVGRDKLGFEQERVLMGLVKSLLIKYKLDVSDVVGHRELAPLSGKTCPNLDMDAFRAKLTQEKKPA